MKSGKKKKKKKSDTTQTITHKGLACEQALCLRKGCKNREEREGKGGEPIDKHLGPLIRSLDVIADHLSARSLPVT